MEVPLAVLNQSSAIGRAIGRGDDALAPRRDSFPKHPVENRDESVERIDVGQRCGLDAGVPLQLVVPDRDLGISLSRRWISCRASGRSNGGVFENAANGISTYPALNPA
jgi:hypothetical protein